MFLKIFRISKYFVLVINICLFIPTLDVHLHPICKQKYILKFLYLPLF